MGAPLIDITGKVFGQLTVLERGPYRGPGRTRAWKCRCSCGEVTLTYGSDLRRGLTRSCGHLAGVKHGESGPRRSVEYTALFAALDRCRNPNFSQYSDYGGRGIFVGSEFEGPGGFANFLDEVGRRPGPEF